MVQQLESKINSELINMDKRLGDLEDQISSIDNKLTQVVDAILGNRLTKDGGFIIEIKELKKELTILKAKVEKQEEFKNKVAWTIGIVVIIAIFIQFIMKIYTDLYK